MANEPNLEHFLALLSEDDFAKTVVPHLGEDENKENKEEILWYLDERREDEVMNAIAEAEDAERDRIFMGLASLYPLSRSLILKILYGFRDSDYGILKGFDFEERMLREIQAFVNKAAEIRATLTQNCKEYRADIEKCQQRIRELEKDAAEYSTLLQQKQELTTKKEQLERDMQEDKLNSDIAEMQADIERLKKQRQGQAERQKDLQKEKASIRKELKTLEGKMDAQKDINLLRELLKAFPSDAEE